MSNVVSIVLCVRAYNCMTIGVWFTLLSLHQTRTPHLPNPDMFRKVADRFLVQSLGSDVSLLYPPSQVSKYL